jgi:acetyl esterase/lipase
MGTKKTQQKPQKQPGLWHKHHKIWIALITVASLALLVVIAFQVSPWPNSLLIRHEFDQNSAKVSAALEKYVPTTITSQDNQQYRPDDNDGYLDVFYQNDVKTPQPTIVWVHGGAWVSGDKNNVDNYLKILASHGFTTVGVDYSIAPEFQYPTPIFQLNDALGYIQRNAERLNIDPNRIILAGDSAGSQVVAQTANAITSPTYADVLNITPTLAADKLRGVLLNCGAYDLALPNYDGPFGGFLHTVLWAYSGSKDFLNDPALKSASVANYLTANFPPSFITAGNTDPLEAQSTELAKKLSALKVPTDTLFYPADHQPGLSHEYQFNLDTDDGKNAMQRMAAFAKERTK